ncbi:MAG TPA: hypothetical protein VFT45_05335 [Longimicrobium sp.]|nr:hypothetical protein [Longimicrobium sp.]
MTDFDDDDPLAREDVSTRKARRLDDLREEVKDALVVGFFGLAMLGMGVGVGWFTFLSLRRGYFDEGERFVYVDQEPGWFYTSTAFFAAMGLGCAVLGVQMLLHARKERRRTARLAERLRRVGRGTR